MNSISIQQEIIRQSDRMGWINFICPGCKHYRGGLKCDANVFIAFTGANTSECRFWRLGQKCPHCEENF